MDPRVTYDPVAGALTVELDDGIVAGTVPVDEEHLVDVDADGRILSFEVLTPENLMLNEITARFGIEDRAPAIAAAISHALASANQLSTSTALFEIHGTVTKMVAPASAGAAKGVSRSDSLQREIDLVP